MFRIGDFAQIGRVSARQLRHYQQMGLLAPEHTDDATGYRYYSARQLPRLNRILALRALGFSLDRIRRLVEAEVPADELRGMLELRKGEIEQKLEADTLALRQIEARILQIEEQGAMRDYDVGLKALEARPWIALRGTFAGFPEALGMLRLVATGGTRAIAAARRGALTVVAHSDFDDQALDLEAGWVLDRAANAPVTLPGGIELAPGRLPAVEQAATLVRSGPGPQIHLAYGALGIWMEANGWQVAGPCREVFLEPPFAIPGSDEVVVEVQFPVTRAAM